LVLVEGRRRGSVLGYSLKECSARGRSSIKRSRRHKQDFYSMVGNSGKGKGRRVMC